MGNISEMVEQAKWRESLKPGDEFAIAGGGFGSAGYDILKVTRLTKTQIIVQVNAGYARRFNIVNGEEIGSRSWQRIQPVTQAIRDAHERRDLRVWLDDALRRKPGLTLEQLRAMRAAADNPQAAAPGVWNKASDGAPDTPANSEQDFIIACRRSNGKTHVFAATYLNARLLQTASDDCPEQGVPFTGWYLERDATEGEYDSAWWPVCESGDEVTHWMAMPAAPVAEPMSA